MDFFLIRCKIAYALDELCQGPIFVKYGECGEELKNWLIKVYVAPSQELHFSSSEESSETEEKPSKWNQHYVKYINGLQADLKRKNHK